MNVKNGLTPKDYQNALDVQGAVNLSGVVRSFALVTERIWNEARAEGGGTEFVNKHPISRLYAEQINFLASGMDYSDAYQTATIKANQ